MDRRVWNRREAHNGSGGTFWTGGERKGGGRVLARSHTTRGVGEPGR
jgi:hypothetical protein